MPSSNLLHTSAGQVPRQRLFTTQTPGAVASNGLIDSSRTQYSQRSLLGNSLRKLQKLILTISEDPEFSRRKIYLFFSPILAFLALVFSIFFISRTWTVSNVLDDKMTMFKIVLVVTTAVLGTLLALRGLIWMTARAIESFLQLDFSDRTGSFPSLESEIMTGMIGLNVSLLLYKDLEFWSSDVVPNLVNTSYNIYTWSSRTVLYTISFL
ncbi:hypothetical protein AAF712_007059 [Marasmius tenuissimus]|uniref:Uncharacterized protein n=1 Tax=Marasmius tenuissimus TaxID=585030 RepID=A0ABR2ZX01_9AGAR